MASNSEDCEVLVTGPISLLLTALVFALKIKYYSKESTTFCKLKLFTNSNLNGHAAFHIYDW